MSDLAKILVSVEIIMGFGLLGFLLSRVAGFSASHPPHPVKLPIPESNSLP